MGEKFEPDEVGQLSQTEQATQKIQKTVASLEAKIRTALKTQDVQSVKTAFSKEVEEVRGAIANLPFLAGSERLDLEAQLVNIDRLFQTKTQEETLSKLESEKEVGLLIDQVVAQQPNLNDEQRQEIKKHVETFFNSSELLTIQKVLNIPNEVIEAMYNHAYHLYRSSKFTEALHLFRLLTQLVPNQYRFYFSIAACLHQQKNYKEAIKVYLLASGLEPNNPIPLFHLADCQKELGFYPAAKTSLRQAIQAGLENPEYFQLVERARLALDGLEKEHSH